MKGLVRFFWVTFVKMKVVSSWNLVNVLKLVIESFEIPKNNIALTNLRGGMKSTSTIVGKCSTMYLSSFRFHVFDEQSQIKWNEKENLFKILV